MIQIFYNELALADGFELSDKPKHDRLIRGRQFSTCSGYQLFSALRDSRIKCWKCSCVADRWISTRGPNDERSTPVLNLYGTTKKGQLRLMTRDHIIPKAYGGIDSNENLRPGCDVCNGGRGSQMNARDIEFMYANRHLISLDRLNRSIEARARAKAALSDPGQYVEDAVFNRLVEVMYGRAEA